MRRRYRAPQFFGNAGREHTEKYGTTPEHFAKIGYKNHKHSVNNPYSQFQDEYSLEQIKAAPMVWEPLTKLQCYPTSDGSGAAILASEEFVKKHGLENKAVEILGMAMTTDFKSTFADKSSMKLVGYDMTKEAARRVYEVRLRLAEPREARRCLRCDTRFRLARAGQAPIAEARAAATARRPVRRAQAIRSPSPDLTRRPRPGRRGSLNPA